MEEITLKKMKLPADKPNYYVPMNEGAFFDLCKAQEKNLSAVSTSGLCGCVAIPIYIKDGNKSYLFLNLLFKSSTSLAPPGSSSELD